MMINKFALSLVVGVAAIGSALGQTSPTTPPVVPTTPSSPAVTTPSTPSAATPLPGANSFTEAQVRARLEAQGFTGIAGLMKDKDGIWNGTAMKGGRNATVSVDYQGNIVEK